MPTKLIVWGMGFVFFISLVVSVVQYFIPLSAKNDMNTYCRSTLLNMEINGGLTSSAKTELINKLTARGFTNITVTGTESAKQGSPITLRVEADYRYTKLYILVSRTTTQRMIYNHTSIERMVVN